jgi:phospholipid-binding lipoprotein MlaA
MPRKETVTGIVLVILLLQACAVRSPYEDANDPLEPVNRAVYKFNDVFDRAILKPAAEAYQDYVPAVARTGVRNFFANLGEPVTIVNDVLQGKGGQAAGDTMRFTFNSIFGVAGLADVATGWGLEQHDEDFGQTFAVWGFGEGWYLMLPFLGPSVVRDTAGLPLQWRLEPVRYYTEGWTKVGVYGLRFVSARADLLSATRVLDTAAVDQYLQVREAYRQKRWYDIHDGNPPEPDFFDEELFDDSLGEQTPATQEQEPATQEQEPAAQEPGPGQPWRAD